MTDSVVMMSTIYILVVVVLIIMIILGIKGIFAVNILNDNLKEINRKIHAFDGIFDFFDGVSHSLRIVNKKFVSRVDYIMSLVSKFRKEDDCDE